MSNITARIYWDDQDCNNTGWAWATRFDGDHDDTGAIDGCSDDATDSELCEAFRSQVNKTVADEAIEVVR